LEPCRSRSVLLLSYTRQLCCSLFTATGRCQTREQVQLLDDNVSQHDCHEQHQSKADRETSNAPGYAPVVVDRSAMCWPAVGSRIHPGFTFIYYSDEDGLLGRGAQRKPQSLASIAGLPRAQSFHAHRRPSGNRQQQQAAKAPRGRRHRPVIFVVQPASDAAEASRLSPASSIR
jgi:hypothetical protein